MLTTVCCLGQLPEIPFEIWVTPELCSESAHFGRITYTYEILSHLEISFVVVVEILSHWEISAANIDKILSFDIGSPH